MDIQAVIFARSDWTTKDANNWLRYYSLKPIKRVHITKNYYRYRLATPQVGKKYRTRNLNNGIKLIITI